MRIRSELGRECLFHPTLIINRKCESVRIYKSSGEYFVELGRDERVKNKIQNRNSKRDDKWIWLGEEGRKGREGKGKGEREK